MSFQLFLQKNFTILEEIYETIIVELNEDITFESFCEYAYQHSQ